MKTLLQKKFDHKKNFIARFQWKRMKFQLNKREKSSKLQDIKEWTPNDI